MKKLLQSLFLLLFVASQVIAQERTVTGKVTAKEDGLPLPGVSVVVTGSNIGTQTGVDGTFSLKVTSGNSLTFTYVGYSTQTATIPASNNLNISLVQDATALNEVVVTGLGGTRSQRSLPYAATKVDGGSLTVARSTDISTALAGKVAGVQLNGSASSTFDNGSIIIRGVNGFTIGDPLFVVDGTPTAQENVNMDNVESVTVLKGAAATALYGQRAYNGVVVVTSKKGSRKGGTSVEFNSSYTTENVSLLPDYQNEYAGGYSAEWPTFHYNSAIHPASWASFEGQKMLEYGADASFGPKIDGSQYRPYYSWYEGADFGKTEAIASHPNNVKDFLRTGHNLNNTLSFAGGGEGYNFRIGYTNQDRSLIQRNADRSMNMFNLNGSMDISKKFTVSTDFQFSKEARKGQPYEEYRNDGLNVVQGFNQWFQRQIDMKRLEANPVQANGNPTSWNIGDPNGTGNIAAITTPQYWDNPFWVADNNYRTDKRNRVFGNIGLKYNLTSDFAIQANVRGDVTNGLGDQRMASGGLKLDYYKTRQFTNNEFNYELNATYKKSFGDFSFDALVGGNLRKEVREDLRLETNGGLSFRNYFHIDASLARPIDDFFYYKKEVRSAFGKASFGYKGFAYVDVTARNDWSSVFAPGLNSYFYPSVSGTFIASEFFPESFKDVLSFAKVRASYAQVGSDIDPYRVDLQFNTANAYGTSASLNIGDQLRDGKIKPALTGSMEVGADLKFLRDRIGLDFSYFVNDNKNQILSVTLNGATGYGTNLINAGKLTNKGFEFALSGTPIKTKNVTWDLNLNFSKSKTMVDEITSTQQNVIYDNSTFFTNSLNLREGQEWGYVTGRTFNRDANGNMIIQSNGLPAFTTNQFIGYARPDYTGGAYSSLRVKNFDLGFSIDFAEGGLFNSTTRAFNMGSGLSTETVGVNDKGIDWRLPVAQGGGYKFPGVLADGTPNKTYLEASTAFYDGMQTGSGEMFMIDASYLKLREIRLGYNVPSQFLASKAGFVKNANLGLIVGNAWLISAPGKKYGIDPSELENFWEEGGQLPQARTFGVNLRVGF
ncbi:SusC/RagA family TonB-linked outer membrane protein [Flavihumibacter sp. R14]|nr:SusC/RagA family TonB-linked outer membrane protein [Flavihumibacter soli]